MFLSLSLFYEHHLLSHSDISVLLSLIFVCKFQSFDTIICVDNGEFGHEQEREKINSILLVPTCICMHVIRYCVSHIQQFLLSDKRAVPFRMDNWGSIVSQNHQQGQ